MPLQPPDGQQIERATEADIPAVAAMLARAFNNDPFWRWLAGAGDDRQQRMTRGFAIQLEHLAMPAGMVYCTPGREAAALWSPPGHWQLGLMQQLRFFPGFLKVVGWRKLLAAQRAIDTVQKQHPGQPHYYLQVLGVDPRHQGAGHGRTLLAPILRLADTRNLPVYLETANPDNIGFYQHYGFEVTREVELPAGAPPVWLMWRPSP